MLNCSLQWTCQCSVHSAYGKPMLCCYIHSAGQVMPSRSMQWWGIVTIMYTYCLIFWHLGIPKGSKVSNHPLIPSYFKPLHFPRTMMCYCVTLPGRRESCSESRSKETAKDQKEVFRFKQRRCSAHDVSWNLGIWREPFSHHVCFSLFSRIPRDWSKKPCETCDSCCCFFLASRIRVFFGSER